ncbi:MAG TPA: hypothetical protein VMU31_04895 [Rhizomicrobium sp.]|nr:hypothetical protein [Rhizomicrobium sp.]
MVAAPNSTASLEDDMLDILFIAAGFAVFLLAVLYTYICDQL